MSSIKNPSVPNFFYDLIVFVSPSILLILGILIGVQEWSIEFIKNNFKNISTIDFIVVLSFMFYVSYEYGRLAEALSSPFVSDIVRFLHKKKVLKDSDFYLDLSNEIEKIELPISLDNKRRNSKWTIYFYAILLAPHIGTDLLKRYAWEKLSRSSAFTFLLLFFISFVFVIFNLFKDFGMLCGKYGFSSFYFLIISFLLTIATFYEYYRRNSWNNDLLIKVLPILQLEFERQKEKNNSK